MIDFLSKDWEPLYLQYGKACFVAQNLETTLRMLLVLHRSKKMGQSVSAPIISAINSETRKEAVFALFDRSRSIEYFTPKEERMLKAAIQVRNQLIHEFWPSNILKTCTPEGRAEVIDALGNMANQIREADDVVVSLVDRYLIEHGLSTEILKQFSEVLHEAGDAPEKPAHH